MFYRVTTRGAATFVTSPLPLAAEDALHLAQRVASSGLQATVIDVDGNVVSLEDLRAEAAKKG